MQFQTVQQLSGVMDLLGESELEEFHLEPDAPKRASVRLLTSRPPKETTSKDWIPCSLTIKSVQQVIVREMPDLRPDPKGLLQWEETPEAQGGVIHLVSAHGLRVEIWVDRIDGLLEDLDG